LNNREAAGMALWRKIGIDAKIAKEQTLKENTNECGKQ
jgi:hypothetical protein